MKTKKVFVLKDEAGKYQSVNRWSWVDLDQAKTYEHRSLAEIERAERLADLVADRHEHRLEIVELQALELPPEGYRYVALPISDAALSDYMESLGYSDQALTLRNIE